MKGTLHSASLAAPNRTFLGAGVFSVLTGVLGALSFWSTALAECAGVLLLCAATWHSFVVRRRSGLPRAMPGIPRTALLLWGTYVAATGVSILQSGGPLLVRAGLLWHPRLFPAALVMPLDRRGLRAAGMIFLLSGTACAIATFTVHVFGPQTVTPFTFTGLTTFADLLVLAGAVSLVFLIPGNRGVRPVWRFAVPSSVITIALLWSAERAPVLAFAAVGSARALAAGPRAVTVCVLIVCACLILGPAPLTGKMEWLIHGNPVDRYVVWEEGLRQAPHAPLFGYGPGSYSQVLPIEARARFMNRAPSSWHNDLLETWLDSGPLAALALGGLLLLGAVRAVGRLVRRRAGEAPLPGGGPGLLFLCLATFGLVGSVVTTSVLGLAFWLLLGLTLSPRLQETIPSTEDPQSS
jgi:O-antigen ligase